jgi:hypothetical protein
LPCIQKSYKEKWDWLNLPVKGKPFKLNNINNLGVKSFFSPGFFFSFMSSFKMTLNFLTVAKKDSLLGKSGYRIV